MEHENARNGMGKVFTSQVLMIVTVFFGLISGICAAVSIMMMMGDADAVVGATIAVSIAGFAAIVAAILLLISYILMLVGLSKAGKDSDRIKSAFVLSIVALIVSFIGSILNSVLGTDYSFIPQLVNIVTAVINLVVTYKILMGCAELNSALSDKAGSTWKMYMIVVILDIVVAIVTVIMGIMGITAVSGVAYMIVVILDFVFDLIAYIMFIGFLARARKEV